jgi:ketosteroid isomerase-like protein
MTMGQDAQQARILSLENAWNQALQIKDVKALDRLLGGEFMDIESDGMLTNKAEYLANIIAPTVRVQHIVNESMEVRLYGGNAVVIGVYLEKGTKNGKPYLYHQRFVDTWIPRNGTWLCVVSQSTLIAH